MDRNHETRGVRIVDAFTTEPMAGIPAGVVPDAEGLSTDGMAAMAAELGAPETAFVLPSGTAAHRLRCFSPEGELDRPGHAAVATFVHLFERGAVPAGTRDVETAAGPIEVETDADGTVWVDRGPAEVETVDPGYDRTGSALGVDPAALSDVGADLPSARVSTGVPVLVVPVNFLEHLGGIDPDQAAVADLCQSVGVEAVHAFTFDTLDSASTAHGRTVTGPGEIDAARIATDAGAATGAYLRRFGAVETGGDLVFEWGHFRDRPGRIRVRVDGTAVRVGGRAVTTLSGELAVPADEDDDIVEA